jgi:hypothetical protein
MKTWYLLAAAVAYYLYTKTPAQALAAAQAAASPNAPGNQVATINVTDALAQIVPAVMPTYQVPTVQFQATPGVSY